MTRKKKTKAQTGPENDPTEGTPEQSGQPEQPETLPMSAPEPSDPLEVEAETAVAPMTGDEAETPRDEESPVVIETVETEPCEPDGAEAPEDFDGAEDDVEAQPSGAEIVSVVPEPSDTRSDENIVEVETETPSPEKTAEIVETGEEVASEEETLSDESVETVESLETPPVSPEDEPAEPESNEFEPANAEPGEGEESPQPSNADIQALDFQAAFRRAFQQPEDEELEAEPLEIEQETADVEDISGEPLARTPAQIKSAAECLLFTTPSPLGARRMANIIGGIDLRTMRGILGQLQAEYDARGSGIQIIESAEGFQMCTRPEHAAAIMQLHRQRKKNPLSPTALETLAIVAYKQPLTRAEIEMIRGVECSGVVRNLCDLDLIKVVGRKEVIGRPQLYGTTARFLQTFGLKAIEELPSIQNLRRRYALDGEEPTTSVSDLMQRAQAARTEAMESEESNAAEESEQKSLDATESEQSDVQKTETVSAEAAPNRQESEEAEAVALGDTPMPLNRQTFEEDADLEEEEDGGDSSEETGDTSDPSEEDIPEEDEAEMDEAEETFIADEDDEADEDEGWDDGKDDEDEEEEEDGMNDEEEERDEEDEEGDWDDEEDEDDDEDEDEDDEDDDDEEEEEEEDDE
jgi:segregation and condensation protein B